MKTQQNINENLESAYREMARDAERGAEALEWAEATIGDVGELSENPDNQFLE